MSDYCEMPEFYDEREVRAAIEHKCCECRRPIVVGEIHRKCTGKWDGEIQSYRQHIACWKFARKVNHDILGECGVPFGGVEEALRDPDSWFDGIEPFTIDMLRREWERIKAA